MAEPSSPIVLSELIAPLSPAEFRARHWVGGAPFVSQPNPAVIAKIKAIEGLASLETLLPKLVGSVVLFGPNAFRSEVPAKVASDFLNNGYNLYIAPVELSVPGVTKHFAVVAEALGVAPWQISVEAFAGKAGGVSTRHYDHDINFQVLLEGEKRWRIEPNRHLENPLRPYHPKRRPDGSLGGFVEAAYSKTPTMPEQFDPQYLTEVSATAGSVVFLPRGYWHEVHSLTSTWSVNIVVRGHTWASAISTALMTRLNESPEFRTYCEGVLYGETEASRADEAAADAHFERLRAAALTAIQGLSRSEAALASRTGRYRWQEGTRVVTPVDGRPCLSVPGLEQSLEVEPVMIAALERLLAFREPFSWSDAITVARELTPIGLSNLLSDLIGLEALSLV